MSTEAAQNYANHSKQPLPIILAAVLAILTIALVVLAHLLSWGLLNEVATIVLAIAVGVVAYKDRISDLCLQNRIIRLEMQLRLEKLGLGARAEQLALNQLIALRFASDSELPALIEKVSNERIVKGSEIKKLVKNWVADHKRV